MVAPLGPLVNVLQLLALQPSVCSWCWLLRPGLLGTPANTLDLLFVALESWPFNDGTETGLFAALVHNRASSVQKTHCVPCIHAGYLELGSVVDSAAGRPTGNAQLVPAGRLLTTFWPYARKVAHHVKTFPLQSRKTQL